VIEDLGTVASKELREILSRNRRFAGRRTVLRAAVLPLLLGLFFGYQAAHATNTFGRGLGAFYVGLMAMSIAGSLVADAVAGERERHTLETLLASPVSEMAILGGKLAAVISYAWGLAMVQLTAVEIGAALGGHSFTVPELVIVAVLSLLEATLAAAFAVQFSLRAPTVRVATRKQAQYAIVVTILASSVNVVAATPANSLTRVTIVATAAAILIFLDAALISLGRARFRRGRLLLD
jgi:ABC-2 type transport system permease protein